MNYQEQIETLTEISIQWCQTNPIQQQSFTLQTEICPGPSFDEFGPRLAQSATLKVDILKLQQDYDPKECEEMTPCKEAEEEASTAPSMTSGGPRVKPLQTRAVLHPEESQGQYF
ncbi:hypothetical protein E2320_000004 [Naja naja]|nr:hypothetical protein E2320_000004 [Naja naja]